MVKWTTLKPVIGKIIRNTRLVDSSYYDSITEWVAEAMGLLKTSRQLKTTCADVPIDFYRGRIPEGIESIVAVTYQGVRIPETGKTINLRPFTSGIFSETIFSSIDVLGKNITAVDRERIRSSYYYKLNYKSIETNLKKGNFVVWVTVFPTDEEGFPMIPDHEEYKNALYWYCRMMMVGAGYDDQVFKYADLKGLFEQSAGRAIAEIKYPTIEESHRAMNTNVRLVKTTDLWDNFESGPEAEGDYLV